MDFNRLNQSFVVRGSSFLVNLFLLNLILVISTIFSLGLLLIPITVGIFYLFRKVIAKEGFYFWRDFFNGFKQNLKISLLLSIIFEILAYLLWVNIQNLSLHSEYQIVYYIYAGIVGYGMFILWIYGSALISRFHITVKRTLYFSFLIGNSHLLTTITLFAFFMVLSSFYFLFNYLFSFVFLTLYLYLISFILFKILKRYEPREKED